MTKSRSGGRESQAPDQSADAPPAATKTSRSTHATSSTDDLDRRLRDHSKPLGDLMREAQRALVRYLERALADRGHTDVGAAHVSLLSVVDPAGSRLADLTERGGRTKQATAELASHLVARGYLTLGPDPADGRAKLYRFTAAGETLLLASADIVDGYDAWLDKILGAAGVASLRTALTTIIAS